MYTKKELAQAAEYIKKVARENHVPESKVRADMMEAINIGRSNPDPLVQAQWAEFKFAGEKPTVEEFILWTASQLQKPQVLH